MNPVVVVGSGGAGLGASVQLAKLGLPVVLLERSNVPGGTVVEGFIHTLGGLFDENGDFLNPGIVPELADRLIRNDNRTRPRRIGKCHTLHVAPETYHEVVQAWLCELGVDFQFGASIVEMKAQNDQVTELVFERNGERVQLQPQSVVDTTGYGACVQLCNRDLVVYNDSVMSGLTLRFSNADQRLFRFPANINVRKRILTAIERDELPDHYRHTWFDMGIQEDEVFAKISLNPGVSFSDDLVDRLSAYLQQQDSLRALTLTAVSQLKQRYEGTVIGDYTLTEEDVVSAREFPDSVGKAFWPIEHWSDKDGLQFQYLEKPYDIPLGCLKVKGYRNLWCAGKSLSAEPRAQSSARVVGTCWQMGIGVAKAIHEAS